MSEVAINLVVIRVSDIERARRFYTALGLNFVEERHGNGPAHLSCEVGSLVLEIYPADAAPASPGLRLGFRVPSVIAAVAALQEIAAEIVSPPRQSRWGLRAVVADPNGYRIEISEASA